MNDGDEVQSPETRDCDPEQQAVKRWTQDVAQKLGVLAGQRLAEAAHERRSTGREDKETARET